VTPDVRRSIRLVRYQSEMISVTYADYLHHCRSRSQGEHWPLLLACAPLPHCVPQPPPATCQLFHPVPALHVKADCFRSFWDSMQLPHQDQWELLLCTTSKLLWPPRTDVDIITCPHLLQYLQYCPLETSSNLLMFQCGRNESKKVESGHFWKKAIIYVCSFLTCFFLTALYI